MAEPPPRDPRAPDEDETIIVPPAEQPVVSDEWEQPENDVFVEQSETVPPRRPIPKIWPALLALLVLVLVGLAAAYFLSQDDEDDAAATTTSATTVSAQPVSVPDVVGTTSSEATATLTGAGLDVNLVAVPSDAPSGQVVAQNPQAGSEVAGGSTVRLNVAEARPAPSTTATTETTTDGATTTDTTTTTAAPEPAIVPDVVGQELADGARALGDEGLKAAVRYVPSQEQRGRIVAQAQPPGTERQRGDTVQVNVSQGADPPATRSVPDVTGQSLDDARDRLDGAGFEVLAIELDGLREDVVDSQSPGGGATIPGGALVLLYVGD